MIFTRERYTRPIHNIHPSQETSYIISTETAIIHHEGTSGIVTFNGPAITKLGQYEDIGSVEEVRQDMEHFKTKK